jgi:hypothetical protein
LSATLLSCCLQPELQQEECFPNAVKYQPDEGGELSAKRTVPVAADARKGKDRDAEFADKSLSRALGSGFDDLKKREAIRRQKRMEQ